MNMQDKHKERFDNILKIFLELKNDMKNWE